MAWNAAQHLNVIARWCVQGGPHGSGREGAIPRAVHAICKNLAAVPKHRYKLYITYCGKHPGQYTTTVGAVQPYTSRQSPFPCLKGSDPPPMMTGACCTCACAVRRRVALSAGVDAQLVDLLAPGSPPSSLKDSSATVAMSKLMHYQLEAYEDIFEVGW